MICFKIRWPSIELCFGSTTTSTTSPVVWTLNVRPDINDIMVVPCGTWYPTSWSCYDSWIETVGTWASKMHILCRPAMWWFSWKIPRPWHTCEGHGQEKCSSSCLALTSGWLEREMDFDVKSSIRSHLTCDGMWCLFLSFLLLFFKFLRFYHLWHDVACIS